MTTLTAAPVITLTRTIDAPIAHVYSAFTDRDWLHDWLADEAHVRNAVGGHILLTWFPNRHAIGQYTALEENRLVAFTLRYSEAEEDVQIEIILTEEDGQTDISVTLTGALNETLPEQWENALDNLKSILETGADLRITNRLLIGIFPGQFDEKVAEKLGVPVKEGTLVNGVLPGLGAEKAGLQANDVVVSINGKAINDENPINVLVQGKKPGDAVEVGFYRNGEKQTATMVLSGYPVPDVPANFAGLADIMENVYVALNTELTALFEGVSEAQAAKKPEPKAWSANEVLAHLILAERWLQNWIGGLIETPEPTGWTGNSDARIAGVVNTYPTTQALMDELRRSRAETVSILRHMPEEMRKVNLWWASFEVQGYSQHTRQHFNQIRDALKAA